MFLASTVLVWGIAAAAPAAPSCAAKDTAFLAALAGEWHVDAEFRLLIERYDGTRDGKPWSFLAILGANGPDAERPIQEVFVHSRHGIMSLSSGRVDGSELCKARYRRRG